MSAAVAAAMAGAMAGPADWGFGARVHRITVLSGPGVTTDLDLPAQFRVDTKKPTATDRATLALAIPEADPVDDPLVVHINRNTTYYMGVLVEAALRRPSLRFDAPQLRLIGAKHEVWTLPLLGFDGPNALVLGEPPKALRDAIELDLGSSTIVQLAAAGFYTEAAQGSLVITDAAGKLHPALDLPLLPALSLDSLGNAGLIAGLTSAALQGGGLARAAAGAPSASVGSLGGLADLRGLGG